MNLDLENALRRVRIVPVIEIADAGDAVPLGRTLTEAGLPVAEVTFRTPAAAEAIARMVREVPGLMVGAGTVLSEADVDAAVDAGAHFLVSPGLNAAVVERARRAGIPIIPGVTSPTEIETARALGLRLLKLFPAEAVGGLPLVKAFAAPYPDVAFMPTGGITADTVAAWLRVPTVAACGGSWIATRSDIAGQQWDDIRSKASQAVQLASQATLRGVPVTATNPNQPQNPTQRGELTMSETYVPQNGVALSGKVAIVSGAASGIGEAVARIFAANESNVLLVDIDEERLEKVTAGIRGYGRGEVHSILADVTDEQSVIDLFAWAKTNWGSVDLLVNSAGRDSLAPPVVDVTLDEWNKTMTPNLTAVFLMCREAFRIMEKQENGGRIINMGSSSARVASGPGHSPYRASKHGLMGFSKNILLEGKDKKIGVTVINPSHVKTPMTEIIDKGLYDGDVPAYIDGWLDKKEIEEGIHASCIEVDNVAEITLYVATRTPDVTIPQIALYPTHKAHRYGMEV